MSQPTKEPDGPPTNQPKRDSDQTATERKSLSDSQARLTAAARRALLKRLLPERGADRAAAVPKLTDDELSLLRQLAVEEADTDRSSALRYRAILQLAYYPTVANLNLLEELCRQGENAFVRSHALLALGNCGVRLAGAVLRAGLAADDLLEKTAAAKALDALARSAGPAGAGTTESPGAGADRHVEVTRQLREIARELALDGAEPCLAIC
jgi:hypothetical protein